jgi:hypothetical protein
VCGGGCQCCSFAVAAQPRQNIGAAGHSGGWASCSAAGGTLL